MSAIYIPEEIRKLNVSLTDRQISRYIDNVWRDCADMKPGDVIVIKEVAQNYPALYIECVKDYMRSHNSTYQEGLSFANGYAELRKYDLVWNKKAPRLRSGNKSANTPSACGHSPLAGGENTAQNLKSA
jgi:hypothetical protein